MISGKDGSWKREERMTLHFVCKVKVIRPEGREGGHRVCGKG